jgi:hypothetical protein
MLLIHRSKGFKIQKAAAKNPSSFMDPNWRNTAAMLLLFWQAGLVQALVAVK